MISKIRNNDVDDILDKIQDLRENIIYMIGYDKVVREEKVEEINNEKKFDGIKWL